MHHIQECSDWGHQCKLIHTKPSILLVQRYDNTSTIWNWLKYLICSLSPKLSSLLTNCFWKVESLRMRLSNLSIKKDTHSFTPHNLSQGFHVIRLFPVKRAHGQYTLIWTDGQYTPYFGLKEEGMGRRHSWHHHHILTGESEGKSINLHCLQDISNLQQDKM